MDLGTTDTLVRMGAVLLRIFAKFSEASSVNYGVWLAAMGEQARRAQAEGDLRDDDPLALATFNDLTEQLWAQGR